MPTDQLLALALYAFVSSITPGPNNMMLLASGANHGMLRSIPYMLGVGLGFVLMLVLVGLGVGQIILANATLYLGLKIFSVAYLLWLAWRIANSGPIARDGETRSVRPFRFIEAALFQWVNPKAWAMALTAAATFTRPESYLASIAWIAIVFGAINIPCISVWTGFGVALRPLLQDPVRVRLFNGLMALLLIASIVPTLRELAGL